MLCRGSASRSETTWPKCEREAQVVANYPQGVVPERLTPILKQTNELADLFMAHGFKLYLVGGTVRDLLLGAEISGDFDFTTNARPDQIKQIVSGWADAVWAQGERFGTIGARKQGRQFEITTHRGEAYNPDSRKPDVAFATHIDNDLARRDFTINAMALELFGTNGAIPELIDPHDGAIDLAQRVLRTPGSPDQSFDDDPLRMLRAARFIAKYGLTADSALTNAVRANAQRLSIVSRERIQNELDKLITVKDPSNGLWFIVDTHLADEFLPELPAMRLEQDPIHRHKDVLAHTIAVVGNVDHAHRIVRLAALFHDVAKPRTRAFGPNGVMFHHHEVVGARMTRDRMKALKYSTDDVAQVSQLVFLHLRFHTYSMGWTDAAVRRYVKDAGSLLGELNELTRCDCTTRNPKKAEMLSRRMDDLERRIAELREQEELDAIRPDIDGAAVMAHLGIGPSRLIGQALAHLLEIRMDEGPLGTEEAFRRLDIWWSTHRPE